MKINILVLFATVVLSSERRRTAHSKKSKHHHHHQETQVKSADAVADEVLNQISNVRYKATAEPAKGGDVPLDKVNVGELSCRARTATNVGLDYLVNHYFKAGKRSFYRYELYRPTFAWSDKDLDFYEIDCAKSCNAQLASELDLGQKKCLHCEDAVATGNARHFFTILYPLIGKLFYTELKTVWDKLKPKNSYEEVSKLLGNLPFEKEYFTAFSKNKAGTCTKKAVMYMLIRNQYVGLNKLVLAAGKLYRVLRCTAFRKYINAEDIYTTIIDNDFFTLKMPAEWINEFVMNTSKTQNLGFNQPKLFYATTLGFLEYFMTSEGSFVSQEVLTEEYNEACKSIRDFMIHLWASARKIKCGDAGWTPAKGVADPLDSTEEDKKEDDAKTDAK